MSRKAVQATVGVLFLLGAASCSAAGRGQRADPRVTFSPQPPEATDQAAPAERAPLPALPVSQVEVATGPVRTVQRLEVVNEDLQLVLRSLAESFDLDYSIDPEVTGMVTARLHGVSLDEALQELITPYGYGYQLDGTVLRVAPASVQTRIFGLDYLAITRTGIGTTVVQRRLGNSGTAGFGAGQQVGGQFIGGGGADIIQSVTVNDLWNEIRVALEGLVFSGVVATDSAGAALPTAGRQDPFGNPLGVGANPSSAYSRSSPDGRRLILNPLSGTILVSAPPAKLAEVEAFLATVEASVQRQVLIEARIVEVSLTNRSEFGINWDFVEQVGNVDLTVAGGSSGAEFRLGGSDGDVTSRVNVVLRALEEQGDVRVLSSPRVSVLNNQRAVINVATDEVFFAVTRQPILGPDGSTIGFDTEIQPQQISVGIVLDVFPQIGPDNAITMNVRPVITDVLEVRELRLEDGTQISAPVIDRRETDTVVRVRGGETIVIGGLIQNSQRQTDSGVPLLSRIPLIGRLFSSFDRSEERKELVIFLTPTIIASQPQLGG